MLNAEDFIKRINDAPISVQKEMLKFMEELLKNQQEVATR